MAEWLLADMGASHTRLALATGDGLRPATAQRLTNADFAAPEALIAAYLGGARVSAICAGVAGPVRAGTAQLTNRHWRIKTAALAHLTGAARVHLMNDLQAQAMVLDDLDPASLIPVLPGTPDPEGARMVLGLGTGSNIAVAHRMEGRLFVPPAEAGHSGLPHLDTEANAAIAALGAEIAHKPYEALLSGPGLARLHRLRTGEETEAQTLLAGADAGPARETIALFARLLGAVAGNLALIHMATGGVFLIGGTARAIAPHLAGTDFAEAFTARGPYAGIMRAIPVTLVTDDMAALRGCWRVLRQAM
ncbi:MAG TPA: glucokinase [Roseovarius sp.]|nr:glucokinase [Roseovarius sp.]